MPRSGDREAELTRELEALHRRVERLEAEKAEYVEAGEQMRFQAAILENMTDWVTVTDLDGRIVYASPSVKDVLGYAPEDLVGQDPAEVYWGETDTGPAPQEISDLTLARGSWRGEVINCTKDGRRIVVGLQTNTICGVANTVIGIIGVARDITDQKRTDEALRRSEERFRGTVDLLPDIVCELDLNMRVVYVNQLGITTFGYTLDELTAMPTVTDLIHPDERERAMTGVQRLKEGERLTSEYRMIRKDGVELRMLVNSSPVYADGALAGIRSSLTDITEYKRAQQERDVSEERYRMLIEAMNDGLGVQDENGVLTFVNERLCKMTGYDEEELLGRQTVDFIAPEVREVFFREVAKRKQRDRTPYELEFVRKDGTRLPTIMSPAPLYDTDGRFRGSFAVLTDITQHKQAEEVREKERHLLQTVINSVPDSIFVKDREGRFVMSNLAHLELLRARDVSEVVGKTDFDFFPREVAAQYHADEQRLLTSNEASLTREERIPDQSGHVRSIYSIKVPLRSIAGETTGIVGVSRDITSRLAALEALRDSEERFRTILENSRDIAYKLNIETNTYEYMSRCAEELLGFTAGEILAMTRDDIEIRVHPEDRAALQAHRTRQGASTPADPAPHLIEYRLRHKNGEYRWFAESAQLIWNESGQLVSAVGTLRDITEQKHAEQAVLAASRMEATSTLAGGIAHEFNNLMVGVLGNAELLQMKLEDRPDAIRMLSSVAKAAQRAGELAQKMLAFARGGKYQPQAVKLNEIILETLHLEERSLSPDVRIERDFEKDLWQVRADPSQMNQVIMNLSINAIEAIEGKGRVTITTRNVELDEDFARLHADLVPGRYVYLAVEDTGKGMSPEVRGKVFEPFFTTKFQGRGLGLAAVYGIIRNHNGSISVYSEEGRGSSFKVYLPAIKLDAHKVVPRQLELSMSTGNETILIIDDEEMVLSVTRQVLECLGYKILIAHNGQEAVNMAASYDAPIHLSILDMSMPVMDGAQAYPLLKKARPTMKVILCSGYELSPSAQALLDAGASAFIQKPFRAERIATEVRKVLDVAS